MAVGALEPVLAAGVEAVARGEPLADHALEPLLEGGVPEHRPVVVRRRHLPLRLGEPEADQQLAALGERAAGEVLAVEAQQVEDHQRRRDLLGQPGGVGRPCGRASGAGARGSRGCPRSLSAITSPSTSRSRSPSGARAEVGPRRRDDVAVAAEHPGDAVGDVDQHADAVPLHLVHPPVARRDVVGGGGEHRAHGRHHAGQPRAGSTQNSLPEPSRKDRHGEVAPVGVRTRGHRARRCPRATSSASSPGSSRRSRWSRFLAAPLGSRSGHSSSSGPRRDGWRRLSGAGAGHLASSR